MKILSAATIGILIMLSAVVESFAQQSLYYTDPYRTYRKGVENYENKNYVVARKYFEDVKTQLEKSNEGAPLFIEANNSYYLAVCAVELFQPDAEKLLLEFINGYHEIPHKRYAYYHLGRLYYRERKYSDAITWFERTEIIDLENKDIAEYKFQLGYSYFATRQLDKAKRYFRDVRNVQNRYYYPANYYYGYIAFTDGDFENALTSFERIESSRIYERVIPYYISQIRFFQGEHEEVVRYLNPIIDNTRLQYYNELRLTLGRSYFELRNFSEALPHLEYYFENSRSIPKEDVYQLAFTHYQSRSYDEAIKYLRELTSVSDSIGQHALYILGDCYLKKDDKQAARTAFQQAARLDYDDFIKEHASFNFGKLSYELGYDREAIQSLNQFVETYPQSDHIEEARSLLTDAFINSANYAEAIRMIENIRDRSPRIIRAYQQAAFFRGLELFNDRNWAESERLLKTSLEHPVNRELQTYAHFWLGEIAFRNHQYGQAIQSYLNYVQLQRTTGAQDAKANLRNAHYGIGYGYIMQQEYRKALNHLKLVVETPLPTQISNQTNRQITNDAVLRTADAHFMLREYPEAVANYDRIIQAGTAGADYALLQKGFLMGLQNNQNEKVATLSQLVSRHPNSIYVDDAIYEKGITYLQMLNYDQAITRFNRLISQHSSSQFVPSAYLNLGLIYFNRSEYNKALENYRMVVDKFPRTEESREALGAVKQISIETGQPDIYINMLETTTGGQVTVSLQDSVTFMAAETHYNNNDCPKAITALDNYLNQFRDGFFILQAHFYRAECHYEMENFEQSVADYEMILSMPFTRYTERSLLRASAMNYNRFRDYGKAFEQFERLLGMATSRDNIYSALLGMMRSARYLDRYGDMEKYAQKLIEDEMATEDHKTEAHFYLAQAAMSREKYDDAMVNFTNVAERTSNIMGAESKYNIAKIQHLREQYESSRATCLDLINTGPVYEEWLVKGLILLADNYYEMDENFQARATLESVLEHHKGEELRAEARKRLDKIEQEEKEASRVITGDEEVVDFEFEEVE